MWWIISVGCISFLGGMWLGGKGVLWKYNTIGIPDPGKIEPYLKAGMNYDAAIRKAKEK